MSTPERPQPPFPFESNLLIMIYNRVRGLQEQIEDLATKRQVGNLQTRVQLLAENENDVAVAVGNVTGAVAQDFNSLDSRMTVLEANVQKLLDIFTPPTPQPAASIALKITQSSQGEEDMATKKFGKFKLDMLPNGHLKATVTVNDDQGQPTAWDGAAPLAYSFLDQAGRTDSLAAVPNADGTSADIGPGATPPAVGDKIVITVSGTTARGTAVSADNSADPVVVKGNPAGGIVLSVTGA